MNDGALAARLAVPLTALLGDANVMTELPPLTGSEDAHLLLGPHKDVPFNYMVVGVADPAVFAAARRQGKDLPYSLHSPDFIVDLAAIPVGTKVATVGDDHRASDTLATYRSEMTSDLCVLRLPGLVQSPTCGSPKIQLSTT